MEIDAYFCMWSNVSSIICTQYSCTFLPKLDANLDPRCSCNYCLSFYFAYRKLVLPPPLTRTYKKPCWSIFYFFS
jgi:hypothetical protein